MSGEKIIYFVVIVFILWTCSFKITKKNDHVFSKGTKTEVVTIILTVQEADLFYNVIDQSTGNHDDVRKCLNILNNQIRPQLDTIKFTQ